MVVAVEVVVVVLLLVAVVVVVVHVVALHPQMVPQLRLVQGYVCFQLPGKKM